MTLLRIKKRKREIIVLLKEPPEVKNNNNKINKLSNNSNHNNNNNKSNSKKVDLEAEARVVKNLNHNNSLNNKRGNIALIALKAIKAPWAIDPIEEPKLNNKVVRNRLEVSKKRNEGYIINYE